jgi:Bacterial Ig domain/DNA/RNA non-specific endonuclease
MDYYMSVNNRPRRQSFGHLSLERLEAREVPALFAVGLLSPFAGDVGESAATFSGGLTLDATLSTRDGQVIVVADTPTDAIQAALVNTITATVGGQSANYLPDPETIATTVMAHLPFFVSPTTTTGQYTLRLEDLALMPGQTPDWDYNDRSWVVTVTPLPATYSDPPTANPDQAVTGLNGSVAISPLVNDTSTHGSYLTISQAGAGATNGTVVVADGRTLVYTPVVGFSGTDTFSYTATNDFGESSTSTVSVTVYPAPLVTLSGPETTVYPKTDDPDVLVRYTLARAGDATSSLTVQYQVTVADGPGFTNQTSSQTLTATFAPGVSSLDQTVSLARAGTDRWLKVEVLPPAAGLPAYATDAVKSHEVFLCQAKLPFDLKKTVDADGSITVTYKVNGVNAGYATYLPLKEYYTWQEKDPKKPNDPAAFVTKKVEVATGAKFELTNQAKVVSSEAGQKLEDTPVGYIQLPDGAKLDVKHDDRSHLVAQMYGGRDYLQNNVPLDSTVNQGRMQTVERRILANAVALADGTTLTVNVSVAYDKDKIDALLKKLKADGNRAPTAKELETFRPVSVTLSSQSEILVPPNTPADQKDKFKDPGPNGTLKTAVIVNK